MTGMARATLFAAAAFLGADVTAAAQSPTTTFEALASRVEIGQSIWVTDAAGHEVHGKLEQLTTEGVVVRARDLVTLSAADVRRVRARDHDSMKNGMLIGLGIGAGFGTAWCIGAIADDSGDVDARVECAEGYTVFPALGTLIGLAVDAIIPGKLRVIYERGANGGVMRGLTMSFAF
jgi:hypothetical protein